MKVLMTANRFDKWLNLKGKVVDLPDEDAERLIRANKAERVTPKPKRKVETAAKRAPKSER